MKKITLLFALLITSIGFSQTSDLITNGNFDNDKGAWTGSEFTVVDGEAYFAATNAGGNPWDTQLVYGGMTFENGKEYVLTFKARSTEDRKITVAIQNVGVWDDHFRQDFDITSTMAEYTATFNATSNNTNVQIGFLMANFGTTAGVYYDDISLSTSTDGSGGGGGTTSEEFCEKVITHLNIGEAQIASAIKLTVANFDANTLKVTIESNDSDPVDFILIPGDVTGSPTVSAPDTSVAGKISLTLTWTATPPTDVLFNLLWSKVSTAGNWQLGEAPTSFKFAGTCETASVFKNELVNITMYPNPTSSKLNISAATTIKSIEIYNVLGKQVMNLTVNNTSKSIDVSNLATGVYLIKYQVENTIGTSKFIKQ